MCWLLPPWNNGAVLHLYQPRCTCAILFLPAVLICLLCQEINGSLVVLERFGPVSSWQDASDSHGIQWGLFIPCSGRAGLHWLLGGLKPQMWPAALCHGCFCPMPAEPGPKCQEDQRPPWLTCTYVSDRQTSQKPGGSWGAAERKIQSHQKVVFGSKQTHSIIQSCHIPGGWEDDLSQIGVFWDIPICLRRRNASPSCCFRGWLCAI